MAKTKPGVTVSLDTPAALRGTKFKNSTGANAAIGAIGGDTVPGTGVGAPLYNSRTVDDYDVKTQRFFGSHGDTIGGLNSIPASGGVGLSANGKQSAQLDQRVPKSAQLPNPKIVTKAAEAAGALGGDVPRGVLGK